MFSFLVITDLVAKRDEYKIAALQAKKAGDKTTALSYMKTMKVCYCLTVRYFPSKILYKFTIVVF